MREHPVGVEEEGGLRYVLGRGKCSRCRVRCWKRSWDGLCMACLVAERDGYKMDSECGTELINEAHMAFAGLANEDLEPCIGTCAGHFGPQAKKLYDRGLNRHMHRYHQPEAGGGA